jgi:hypothetical protein
MFAYSAFKRFFSRVPAAAQGDGHTIPVTGS